VLFEPGEVVRVTDGPFTTSTGWWSRELREDRLQVAVQIWADRRPWELEFLASREGLSLIGRGRIAPLNVARKRIDKVAFPEWESAETRGASLKGKRLYPQERRNG